MADKITFDSAEPPDVGIGQPGITWRELEDYVRVAHKPVLVLPPGETQYKGVYWNAATATIIATDELGTAPDEALRQFRAFLRQPG